MAEPVEVVIKTKVLGKSELDDLANAFTRLKNQVITTNQVQKQAELQARIESETLRQNTMLLKAKIQMSRQAAGQLANETIRNQQAQQVLQQRMQFEQDLIQLKQLARSQNMQLSEQEARIITAMNMQIIKAEEAAAQALQMKRRALMQASISMFVLNISVGQLANSLKPLVANNEEATKVLDQFQAMLQLTLGPMQAFMALQSIHINLSNQQKVAMLGVVAAMGAAFFWYAAITAKSREMKIVLGALAGAMTFLAVRQAWVAISAWQAAIATAAQQGVSTFGASLAISAPIIAGGLATAALVGGAIGALLPTAQTEPGQRRRIDRTGLAVVHAGEIMRPTGADEEGRGIGNVTVILPRTYRGTVSESKFFAKETVRQLRAGQGASNFKVVVSNG